VLASCISSTGVDRLWTVPLSGAAAALTAPPVSPDYGDLDGVRLGSDVYVQAAGGCGAVFLARRQPDGTTRPVVVPDVDTSQSVFLVGVAGGRLALRATVACGSGVSALWFDPAANTTTVVLGPPVNGGGVTAALLYPDASG